MYNQIEFSQILVIDKIINITNVLIKPNLNRKLSKDNKCSQCNVVELNQDEANKFSFISEKKQIPSCVKTDKKDNYGNYVYNCCIVEDQNIRYSCPESCFTSNKVNENLNSNAIFNQNGICSDIKSDHSNIKPEIDYDILYKGVIKKT